MVTIAHVRSTTTVHVRRFDISCRETKVCEFDNDFAFTTTIWSCDHSVCDDEVFWFDITMENVLCMASSYCVTHLREHGRYETKTSAREQVRGM